MCQGNVMPLREYVKKNIGDRKWSDRQRDDDCAKDTLAALEQSIYTKWQSDDSCR
jgi:hypothetical protein